jgi:hypothetical protein
MGIFEHSINYKNRMTGERIKRKSIFSLTLWHRAQIKAHTHTHRHSHTQETRVHTNRFDMDDNKYYVCVRVFSVPVSIMEISNTKTS